jgi:thiamine pyrophosphate-dependent acetolactate synthase large subunit-like protein
VSTKVSDYLLRRLREWDVEHVFAYPGDGINGLLSAWGRADDKPRFIQARHEEMSAFEAVGYAKFSGRVGVCAATSGPGAIHLLNGLYDAKLDHVPVVAIVGQTNRSAMGGSYQQEVDLLSLYKDVASEYCEMVTVPEQLPNVIDRALRTAYSRRTVTAVIIPAERRAAVDADPINPEYVVHALDALLPDDVVIAADSGSAANWYARHLRIRGHMRGSLSGTLATMGPGVPYVIGAEFAHPDRPAVAIVGDGAMQMNGMAELVTAAKYRQGWANPTLVVAVLNNQDSGPGFPSDRARAASPAVHHGVVPAARPPHRRARHVRRVGGDRVGPLVRPVLVRPGDLGTPCGFVQEVSFGREPRGTR